MYCSTFFYAKRTTWLAMVVLAVCSICSIGIAQNSRGTILGHVTDPSGAAVSGAKATVKNINTNGTSAYTTNDTGDFIFLDLIPGTYQLTVSFQGFKTAQSNGLIVDVDHTLRQNMVLTIGSVSDQVQVTADGQMLQSDNSSLGSVISSETIEELPLSGRDFENLLKLQAGATTLKEGSQSDWTQHGFNTDFQGTSIDGARSESIAYLMDGVSNNDQFFASAANVPGSDSIAEFKVQNGMYGAEYGQGAAQVNVAIKSGANKFHGSAYDYLQNDALNPSNPYNKWKNENQNAGLSLKDKYKQNQLGGSLSGPLIIPRLYNGKDKTFWFGNYEVGLKRQSSSASVVVPSDKERQGDFSDWEYQLYDPATTGQVSGVASNPAGRQAFTNNQIASSRFNSVSKNILAYYPKANVTCGEMSTCSANYNTSLSKPFDTAVLTYRVDHQLTSNDKLYFTSIYGDMNYTNNSAMPYTGERKYTSHSLYGFTWQHVFNSNMANDLHFGYTHEYFNNGAMNASFNLQSDAGFQNVPSDPDVWSVPNISMSYYQTLGNGNSYWFQKNNNYQVVDNFTFTLGRHTIYAGFDIRQLLARLYDNYSYAGSLSFKGNFTASDPQSTYVSGGKQYHGNAFADYLLGYPMSESSPNVVGSDDLAVHATNYNFFVQDDWRILPTLTVNLGIRYELPPAYQSSDKSGMNLDLSNGGGYKWADQSFVNEVSAVSGVNANRIRCCVSPTLVQSNHANFAPRVGFAWRPLTSNRFVVRGGYGLFYDIYSRYYDMSQWDKDKLWTETTYDYSGVNPTGAETAPTWTMSNLWAASTNSYSWFQEPEWYGGAQINYPKNKNPYTQQWTLDMQYALTQRLLLDLGYVGSHALHLPGYWYFNSAPMPSGSYDSCNYYRSKAEAQQDNDTACLNDANFSPVDVRKPYANLSATSYANANIFRSNYNSMQVKLTQRYSQGLQYSANYTWSRSLDLDSSINNVDGESGFLQDQHNLAADYGPANFDQTQRFVLNGVYELPFGKGKRWPLNRTVNTVAGGWKVSGIYTIASGTPFTIYSPFSSDRTQAGTRSDIIRPNQVGDPHSGSKTIYKWFNTSAYQALGHNNEYGNTGRNTVRGPYYMKTDFTLGKVFQITERNSLQYKVEIFNVGSEWHSDAPTPDHTLWDSTFGSIVPNNGSGALSLWTPRTIQMDLKYSF